MVFQTISISALQKSPAQALKSTHGLCYILQNNRKAGGVVDASFLRFIEENDLLESYEDWLMANDISINMAEQEVANIIRTGDYSKTLSYDELCQSF